MSEPMPLPLIIKGDLFSLAIEIHLSYFFSINRSFQKFLNNLHNYTPLIWVAGHFLSQNLRMNWLVLHESCKQNFKLSFFSQYFQYLICISLVHLENLLLSFFLSRGNFWPQQTKKKEKEKESKNQNEQQKIQLHPQMTFWKCGGEKKEQIIKKTLN